MKTIDLGVPSRSEPKTAGAGFGYEVLGIDLASGLPDSLFDSIERLFDEQGLIVLRKQHLSPDQHIAFSRRFGPLEIHFLKQFLHPQHPELLVVSNIIEDGKALGQADAGQAWHTDLSYVKEPSRQSLLYAIEIPHRDGKPRGDTLFSTTSWAYDALSEDMKTRLQGLQAVHTFGARYKHSDKTARQHDLTEEQRRRATEVVHPVVRRHPVTGRKCIYVNPVFTTRIVGMQESEGAAMLQALFAHCIKPEFVYRHQWQVGDLVMWDNCSTLHCAVADYSPSERRHLQKTTVKGSVPIS